MLSCLSCGDLKDKDIYNIQNNKIYILGDQGVGKTNIINRYIYGNFDTSSTPTLGSAFGEKKINKEGTIYLLKIWDTAGQEKFNSITKLFIRGSQIILLVYSIDNLKSFENLKPWIDYIRDELPESKYVLGIVGNKTDLYENEVITEEQGKKYATDNNAFFYLVSAKCEPRGIQKLFELILDEFIYTIGDLVSNDSSIKIDDSDNKRRKCC